MKSVLNMFVLLFGLNVQGQVKQNKCLITVLKYSDTVYDEKTSIIEYRIENKSDSVLTFSSIDLPISIITEFYEPIYNQKVDVAEYFRKSDINPTSPIIKYVLQSGEGVDLKSNIYSYFGKRAGVRFKIRFKPTNTCISFYDEDVPWRKQFFKYSYSEILKREEAGFNKHN